MRNISFGEILWDVIGQVEHLGGATFNLSAHLAKLGNESCIISAVGHDARGKKILAEAKRLGVKDEFLQINNHPTGYVQVEIDKFGKPTYDIHEEVAYDYIKDIIPKQDFDYFCFGTLAQRNQASRVSLYKILNTIKTKEVFFDVNLRQNYFSQKIIEQSLSFSTIVKLNDEEVVVLSKLLFNKNLAEKDFSQEIIKKYDLKIVLVTRGSKGCAAYSAGSIFEIPGINIEVKDTVGAGDAFSAGFLHQYFLTKDLKASIEFANKLGAFVASQAGAIPDKVL